MARISSFAAGSRAVDANANRYRCITELSTVRCVRDKVSPLVVRFNGPGEKQVGHDRYATPASSLSNVPNVEQIQRVYTDYLQADEIKRITRDVDAR